MERRDGRGRPVAPKSQEQGRGKKESKERQPLPNVWDVLERRVRIEEEAVNLTYDEYHIKLSKVNRTLDKLAEKGTPRDRLIQDLYEKLLIDSAEMLVKELKQFRSQVEPMSDDEIREEIRKSDEEHKRKLEKKGQGFPPHGGLAKS
jgi:hypothetical protein